MYAWQNNLGQVKFLDAVSEKESGSSTLTQTKNWGGFDLWLLSSGRRVVVASVHSYSATSFISPRTHATPITEVNARILANAMDPLESLQGTFFSDSELNSFQTEQK